MSGLMGGKSGGSSAPVVTAAPAPAPTPQPTAPMPDNLSPQVLEARRRRSTEAMARGGRASTLLSNGAPATPSAGADYSANLLAG